MAWSKFVANHPRGNIFQTPEMYEVYKGTYNYEPIVLAVLDDADEILALLHSVIMKEGKGLKGMFSARAIIWGAPLYVDDNRGQAAVNLLMTEYDNIARKRALFTQIRNLWDMSALRATLTTHGYVYEEHLNFLVDLTKSPDTLWMNFSQSKRRGVRKAEKAGLIFSEECDKSFLDIFYNRIMYETYRHAKMPYPDISIFEHAFNKLLQNQMIKFFAVKYRDECIAGMAALMYKGIMYEWYVGSLKSREILKLYPNEYLIWNVLKWGANNDYRLFDFLGAGKPGKEYGVRDFKSGFGGDLVNFGRFERVYQPKKLKVSKKMFEVYRLLRLTIM
jgi:lipid II:glycine glycyltransferase (peptidoglycan interpeptide bridge formation enzyme)